MNNPENVSAAAGLAHFLRIANRLKRTPRTGWLDRGVAEAEVESVAEHSFQTALLAWLTAAGDPTLDRERVLKLALLHDLAEAITGDQTPYEPAEIPVQDEDRAAFLNRRHLAGEERAAAKRAAEAAAFAEMIAPLAERIRTELAALWRELEARATPEAKFVKQADRLETYLQSLEYQERQSDLPVASFAAEVEETVEHPVLVELRRANSRQPTADSRQPTADS